MSVRAEISGKAGWITLDRPRSRNAFDGEMTASLTEAFRSMGSDEKVRCIILRAEGDVFSAGADLAWMKRMAASSAEENLADARQLAALMRIIDICPKPTMARVQGLALGGALGLIACCDIAVAAEDAEFGLSEVRLGLIPAVIGPYVIRAIGPRAARKLFLTGERIPAAQAHRLGLIHENVPARHLDEALAMELDKLLSGGPAAQANAKALIADILRPVDSALIDMTSERIAAIRSTPEAREGLAAFLEKRKPDWSGA